jgi:ubiquinone/menaquinone biosynthesis C-methylase UbiE
MRTVDIQNHHFRITFDGRQYFAPGADSAKRVLDVGTGTGIWAIEFGIFLTPLIFI